MLLPGRRPIDRWSCLQQGRRVLLGERRRRFDRLEDSQRWRRRPPNGDRDGDGQKKRRALMRRVFGVLGVFEMFVGASSDI